MYSQHTKDNKPFICFFFTVQLDVVFMAPEWTNLDLQMCSLVSYLFNSSHVKKCTL